MDDLPTWQVNRPCCGPGPGETLARVSCDGRRRDSGMVPCGPAFDFPKGIGVDEFTATKAIAAAADIRVTAHAMR